MYKVWLHFAAVTIVPHCCRGTNSPYRTGEGLSALLGRPRLSISPSQNWHLQWHYWTTD